MIFIKDGEKEECPSRMGRESIKYPSTKNNRSNFQNLTLSSETPKFMYFKRNKNK